MKILIYCLLIVVSFFSCLPQDNYNSYQSTNKRIKSMEIIDSLKTTIWNFDYKDNDFITSISVNSNKIYEYEYFKNDYLIDKMKDNSQGESSEIIFEYSDSTTIKVLEKQNEITKSNKIMNFNLIGLISSEIICNNDLCNPKEKIEYTYEASNNILKIDSINLKKHEYSYDNNNNPFKNSLSGFKIANKDIIFNIYNTNNILEEKIYSKIDDENPSETIKYNIKYDKDLYPINIIGTKKSNNKKIIEYNFTYF